jgi:glucan 1,3-beta-glucosidase
MIREITGTGAGHGPFICIHDGFRGPGEFAGFLSGSDRMIIDTHPYFAFNGESNTEPIGVDGLGDSWPARACAWAAGMDTRYVVGGIRLRWLTHPYTIAKLLLVSRLQESGVLASTIVDSS